ncbi:hypothetical protein W823_03615 [Williamsia sp. D3]|nr:hypothetical protein W823_03615 [Williamsia sp. D3]
MAVLRAVWWGMALTASVYAIAMSMEPVAGVSLSCSKTGVLGLDGDRSSLQCGDSLVNVLGVWPLVQLGMLLTIPPVLAALVMRRWMSWLVVATFVALTFIGVANWASFWVSLWIAAPMAIVGLVAATVQHLLHSQEFPKTVLKVHPQGL